MFVFSSEHGTTGDHALQAQTQQFVRGCLVSRPGLLLAQAYQPTRLVQQLFRC